MSLVEEANGWMLVDNRFTRSGTTTCLCRVWLPPNLDGSNTNVVVRDANSDSLHYSKLPPPSSCEYLPDCPKPLYYYIILAKLFGCYLSCYNFGNRPPISTNLHWTWSFSTPLQVIPVLLPTSSANNTQYHTEKVHPLLLPINSNKRFYCSRSATLPVDPYKIMWDINKFFWRRGFVL